MRYGRRKSEWRSYYGLHQRQEFMADLQSQVVFRGGHGGQIDWATATYMYNEGKTLAETIDAILKLQKKESK